MALMSTSGAGWRSKATLGCWDSYLNAYKVETVTDVGSAVRWTALTVGQWLGLAPDDSPLVARDIGNQEIYALEMQWP